MIRAWLFAIGILGALTVAAEAEPGRLAVGPFIGLPGDGSAPIGVTASYDLRARGQLQPAISAGLGVPIAGVGVSLWSGLELRFSPLRRLWLYTTPGLRTGFVGPGYYARHSGVFVGSAYVRAGPWTIAPRAPLGVAISLGRCTLYVEVLAELPLLPTPELMVGGALGLRVRL